jgi:hypothetical protein
MAETFQMHFCRKVLLRVHHKKRRSKDATIQLQYFVKSTGVQNVNVSALKTRRYIKPKYGVTYLDGSGRDNTNVQRGMSGATKNH